jgi:hypothetical protein
VFGIKSFIFLQIFYSYITALGNGTNPEFESLLRLRPTFGQKFFNKMSKLDMDTLNDLVDAFLKQKMKSFDYPTECKLRKTIEQRAS